MFRTSFRAILICCAALGLYAQEPQTQQARVFPYESECGNPTRESSYWLAVFGKVEKVISGKAILLRVNKTGKSHLIELAAVKTPFRFSNAWNIAKLELENRVLGKEVSVWVSSSSALDSSADLIGVLFLGPTDINFDLINLGLCKYRRAPAYSMSNYTECTYRQAEKAAIQAKRGVWHD